MFDEYIRVSRTEGVDNQEATNMVTALLDDADAKMPKTKGKTQDIKISEKTESDLCDTLLLSVTSPSRSRQTSFMPWV